jgi:hypothetical protein
MAPSVVVHSSGLSGVAYDPTDIGGRKEVSGFQCAGRVRLRET